MRQTKLKEDTIFAEQQFSTNHKEVHLYQLTNYFMHNDEKAIRDLVDSWLAASKKGDLATVRDLMADDVVFMVPGKEPFGKEAVTA